MSRSKSPALSIVLAVYNEESNLDRCLKAVEDLEAEIVVVDGASTDKTVRIAKEYGARVIETTNKPIFHINKQMAINAARGKWVLQLDADEVVDKQLRKSMRTIVEKNTAYNAFYLKRKNYFMGAFLKKGGQYPDPVIRFFRRSKAYLPQKDVHEQMVVEGEVGVLAGHLLHYNAPTFYRYIQNANRYTSLTANKLHQEKVVLNWVNDMRYLIWKPGVTFVNLFWRHRGYVDGFRGFVFALFSGLHHALAYMKLADIYRHESSH